MVSSPIVAEEKKELDDLVSILRESMLNLHDLYMSDTYGTILNKIETEVNSVYSNNVIWIRGSSSIGKSALVASILIQLQNQEQCVILFQFDCTQSTTITTDAL